MNTITKQSVVKSFECSECLHSFKTDDYEEDILGAVTKCVCGADVFEAE